MIIRLFLAFLLIATPAYGQTMNGISGPTVNGLTGATVNGISLVSCTSPNASISFSSTTPFTVGDSDRAITSACAGGGSPTLSTNASGAYCTIVSNAVHAVAAGSCIVYADCSAAGGYCADQASQSITVSAGSTIYTADFTVAGNAPNVDTTHWTTPVTNNYFKSTTGGVWGNTTAAWNENYWSANAIAGDQKAYVRYATVADGGPAVRAQSGVATFYGLIIRPTNYAVYKIVNGSTTTLLENTNRTNPNTSKYELRVSGTSTVTLKVYIDDVQIGSDITDASATITGGQPGLYSWSGTTIFSSWGGGAQ